MERYWPPAATPDWVTKIRSREAIAVKGFWDDANMINALLALGELHEARERLASLHLSERSQDERESASRFYDDIVSSFGCELGWRACRWVIVTGRRFRFQQFPCRIYCIGALINAVLETACHSAPLTSACFRSSPV